jgi:predicted permease
MLSDLRFRLRSLFKRRQAEADLDDELRFHIERQAAKARDAGVSPEEADRQARLQFGALAQIEEECRDARGLSALETTWQDVRFGFRTLAKSPVFTTVALLLLALGVGVSTAVFSVANQVLLRGLAVKDPAELSQLAFHDRSNHVLGTEISYPAFEMFAHASKPPFTGIFAVSEPAQLNVISGGVAALAHAVFESADAPSVLGLEPALGRLLNAGDAKASSETSAVFLSYAYWQKRFAGDTRIIGHPLIINSLPFVIAGVTPKDFRGVTLGISPDLILPAYTADSVRGVPTVHNRNSWGFSMICRRKPGVTERQMQAALEPAFARVLEDFTQNTPPAMAGTMKAFASKLKFRVISASLGANSQTRAQLERPLTILIVITSLVFLLAGANLAGLLLSRTASRTTEIGVRLAIGCGRARLIRQLLTESALLAVLGGAAGIFAALWTGPLLLRVLGGEQLAEAIHIRPDLLTLAFGLALTVAGALLAGIAPALYAMRVDPQLSIRTSRSLAGPEHTKFARAMIVMQVAASLILALTAGQFVRSLQNYEHVNSGFRPDHLITVSLRPGLLKYTGDQCIAYAQRIYTRLSELPGIKSVTFSTSVMGQLTWNTLVNVPGYKLKGTLDDTVGRNVVGPRFAETLGLTLISGRHFDARDTRDAPATVIVNQSFARHFFGTDDVLGRQIFFIDSVKRPDTIIGVVRDAHDRGLKELPKPVAYSNYNHDPLGWLAFTVLVQQDPKFIENEIISVIKRFVPQVPVEAAGTAEVQLGEALQRERTLAVLSAILGVLATVVAMIGLYGLLAYSVTRRTREIGIRMALGARSAQVQWIAIRDGLLLLVSGIAIGFPFYLAFSRLLRAQVFEVAAADPAALSMALGLLTLSAGLATYIPAWRSARVNPIEALKCE